MSLLDQTPEAVCRFCRRPIRLRGVATNAVTGEPLMKWCGPTIHCDYTGDEWPWGNRWNHRDHEPEQ